MKAFHFLICLFAAFGLFSCSQDEVFIEGTPSKGLTAEIPDYQFESQTRVSISKDLSTFTWSDGDQLGIYYQEGTSAASAVFTTLKGGTSSSTFNNTAFALKPSSTYYAFYPYSSSATVGAYPVDFTGQVQSGNGGTSHIGARNYMAATVKTDNNGDASINFKNLGSVIQVVLPVEKTTTFTSLSISTDTEAFITRGNVDMKTGIVSATEKGKEITLSFGSGITLSVGSQLTANILMAPVDLSGKELTFTLNSNNGEGHFSVASKTLSAGKAYRFTGESLDEIPYLTFTADASQTLTMSKAVETLEYSVNGSSWQELGTKTVTFGGANGKLRVRGKSSIGTAKSSSDASIVEFGNCTNVVCSGDIRTLVDYDSFNTTDTSQAKFCHLFKNCNSLTHAPELPATTLAAWCYRGMFRGCTSLIRAPELPATMLADYCYYDMFECCSSLTCAPELPATTLAFACYTYMFKDCTSMIIAPGRMPATMLTDGCYGCMFENCTSLIYAPELPATKLAKSCYAYMFKGCTSLTLAPELPATTLAVSCYYEMFENCISLTYAPILPATMLVESCYYRMFSDCNSLKYIKILATDISASNCLFYWTKGVSSTGTFVMNAAATWNVKGNSGIPSGWNNLYEGGNGNGTGTITPGTEHEG